MQAGKRKIVVLGTGGTIAGLARGAAPGRYQAAQKPVGELLSGVARPVGMEVEVEQVAQIDSKDMDLPVWQALLRACRAHLTRADVRGLVITHGTDTLEETAWLLQALLAPRKPVVLTCAMRPADAPDADGPGNLADALAVVTSPEAHSVLAVCAGRVMSAQDVQKVHNTRLDAFSSGEAGDLGCVQDGRVQWLREQGAMTAMPVLDAMLSAAALPRVDIVLSHAGADGVVVDALAASGTRGIVVAATGNGTLHHALQAALARAQAAGVQVRVASRCLLGHATLKPDDPFQDTRGLSPVKARLALQLDLLARDA